MTDQPPTEQQLDEIAKAVADYQQHPDIGFACCSAHPAADAGAALLAEVRRQRTELAVFEMLAPQQCPAGLHADWLVDSEYAHACPWCRVAELEVGLNDLAALVSQWHGRAAKAEPRAAELAAVHAFLDEQERAARLFELPTPAWVEAMRAASVPPAAPLSASHTSSVSESAQSPTGAPEGALRPSLSVGASEICGKCKKPFDLADTSRDGHNRFYLTPYCRRCVDACHDTEIADHRCVICA